MTKNERNQIELTKYGSFGEIGYHFEERFYWGNDVNKKNISGRL